MKYESKKWWDELTDLQKQQYVTTLLPSREWSTLTSTEIERIYYRTQEL